MPDEEQPYQVYNPQALLIVVSGPSGVGKDATLQELKRREFPLHYVVTVTSRPKRDGEVEGVDYFFVTREQFERLIQEKALLEYAVVYNDYKGIPKEQVSRAMQSGLDVILRVDVQGAATLRKLYPEAVLIFLAPESEYELRKRLLERRTETSVQLQARLDIAKEEMKRCWEFDYVVVNSTGRLCETAKTIEDIIHAEHHHIPHRKVRL